MKEFKREANKKSAGSRLLDCIASFSKNNHGGLLRLGYIFAGFVMVLSVKPWATHIEIFFRGGRWGMPIRWGLAGVGLFLIFFGLLYRFPKKYHEQGTICPKCQTPFGIGQDRAPKSGKCPDCNVEIEPLDGFYDRHPELKDKENEFPDDLMDDLK